MRAISRLEWAFAAIALAATAVPALAQEAPEAPAPASESNTVGPSELEDFNLPGTVTRPADPAPAPRREAPPPRSQTPAQPAPAAPSPTAARPEPARPRIASPAPPAERPGPALAERRGSVSLPLPPLGDSPTGPASQLAPAPAPKSDRVPLPWLLAALALLGGAAAYWWLGRARSATAGGPSVDRFVAPVPEPRPAPGPAAAPPPEALPAPPPLDPAAIGVVSTRLRPWLEIDMKPLRFAVEETHVAIDIELTLFNSGSLPARAILLEAALVNAGPNQDRDLDFFFSNPIGAGKRATSLAPLKKAVVRSRVITKLEDTVQYEVEGRKVYVPLVAVNALYSWPSGEGQTAGAYLVGRVTSGEKLGPFRIDRGRAAYEPVDKRQLDNGTRV